MASHGVGDKAEACGFDPARLERVEQKIRNDIAAGKYDGARILVARRGVPILDVTVGYAERETQQVLKADAVFNLMSIAKVITAVAVMQCFERGDLGLLTKVTDFIPEFAMQGKGQITVAQLLTHTAGLGFAHAPLPVDQLGNLQKVIEAACRVALENVPGEVVSYSASVGFAVLGELVRRVDSRKRSFRQIITEEIFEPLGMRDSSVGIRPDLSSRRVPVVVRDNDAPELNREFTLARDKSITAETEMPAGAATYATGSDLMRFAEMLRGGGQFNGARLLSPATVKLMSANHTGLKPSTQFNPSRALHGLPSFPAYHGLGMFLRGEGINPNHIPVLASSSSYGGMGMGSGCFWVDPQRELSFVGLTSGLLERIRHLVRFQTLGDMVISALVEP
ncbi:MAG: serine hydrolase domain-containing protein [Burkholderiales bacterium]